MQTKPITPTAPAQSTAKALAADATTTAQAKLAAKAKAQADAKQRKADKAQADAKPAKPNTKPQPKAATKPEPKAAKAPAVFVHNHAESGLNASLYTGLSSYVNANRKPRIASTGPHKHQRNASQITERMQKCLYAMRAAFGTKQFQARGFDNAIIANLTSAGLLRHVTGSGQLTTIAEIGFLCDGEKPLQFAVTSAGSKYGKA